MFEACATENPPKSNMIKNDICNNDSLRWIFKFEWSLLNQAEWHVLASMELNHTACYFLRLNESFCFCWLTVCWTLLKIHLTLKLRSPMGLEEEQNRSLQRNVQADMKIRRRTNAEAETFPPHCKMLQAQWNVRNSCRQVETGLMAGWGWGEGFTISCVRKTNRKFSPKCLLVKLDLRFKRNLEKTTINNK